MLALAETLTHANARSALNAGLARIASGETEVDCSPLRHFDSSALAVLLSWRRAALARGSALALRNLPADLASLAQAYGIESLVS
ncbi:MAG: STAS domain-containing protein [Janthinobacterium lividum]